MRKILVPFALMGLCSLPLVACEVEDDGEDATTTSGTTTTTSPDTSVDERYFAIIIDDSDQFDGRCATSSVGAHGADIDAVELIDGNGGSLGYLSVVIADLGTQCNIAAKYTNVDEVKGAPDGTLTENFVALGGGRITGAFTNSQLEILNGYDVTVYEIDNSFCPSGVACVGTEDYSVYVTQEVGCADDPTDCDEIKIGDGSGEATLTINGL